MSSQYVRIAPTSQKLPKPFAYSIKVINRERKSDYTVKKLRSSVRFSSFKELNDSIHGSLEFVPLELGFIEPGHGLKGRLRWISNDTDLEEMYTEYPKKREFLLWCYTINTQVDDGIAHKISGQKRAASADPAASTSKRKAKSGFCEKKVTEVEEIIQDLRDKHGTKFSTEQLSMWAHVIHIGKHSSRETPPDLPFFRQSHKKTTPPSSHMPLSSAGLPSTSAPVAVSPGKPVSLRSECINQLDKWHSLHEKGIITQEQYDDMQKAILSDMFKF